MKSINRKLVISHRIVCDRSDNNYYYNNNTICLFADFVLTTVNWLIGLIRWKLVMLT